MMICCFLCLKKKTKQIKICSKKSLELNISSIIAKHFWLKPNTQKNSKDSICITCWDAVKDFHNFYETIAEAHNFLETEIVNLERKISDEALSDPLPKCEDKLTIETSEQPLDIEVKLEINDLEFLPINDTIKEDVHISERALRSRKINCQPSNESSIENITNKTKKNDIKQEELIDDVSISDDSEIEVPLSMFLHSQTKTENETKYNQIPCSPKRRKLTSEKLQPKPTFTIPKESETIILQTNINDDQSSVQNFESINDYNDDYISLHENLNDSDSDGLDCLEIPEKFAVIPPPRIPVRPKKHKKRDKPKKESKRMTKEEIEMRRLDQEKYDEIIARLFDKFPCPKCQLFVRNFGDLRTHFNSAHEGKGIHVECCGRRFNLRKTLSEHVLVHLNPEHFKCSKCNEVFQDSISLKEHEYSHDLPPGYVKEKQTYDCEICSKKLATKESLKNHILGKHTPKSEYKFTCEECNKKLPTKDRLKKHLRRDHGSRKGHICEKCGKILESPSLLKKHMEYEHLNIPRPEPEKVQCTICGFWLKNAHSLKEHTQYIHEKSQIEPRCHICGYLSSNERALKKHISFKHTLERKYKCTLCEKAFKRPIDLKEHTSTHTGEVLYTCPTCAMTFFCKANFHKHRQRRHGYQPIRRNMIGKTSKRQKKVNETEEQIEQSTNHFNSERASEQMSMEDQFTGNL